MKNRRSPKPQSRRLFVESLERREVLAGNVTATLVGGLLTVTGDAAANRVVIWQDNATGQFKVTGQTQGTATKINNGPNNNTVTFTGPVTSIYVDAKAGNDYVTIARGNSALLATFLTAAAVVPGTVSVYGGAGNDTIGIAVNGGNLSPTPAVIIDGGLQSSGAQNDTVNIASSFIGAATINTYLGNDNVNVAGSVFSSLSINTGWVGSGLDNDNVNLLQVAAFSASVSMGASGNTAALDNTLTVLGGLYGALTFVGGSGVDTVNIGANGAINRVGVLNASINTLGGNDTVIVNNFQAGLTNADFQAIAAALGPLPFGYDQLIANFPGIPGSLTINTDSGNDRVRLTNTTVSGSLLVLLGAGNDQFISTVVAGQPSVTANIATIDGGLGTDRRSAGGIVAALLLNRLSFEGPNNLVNFV